MTDRHAPCHALPHVHAVANVAPYVVSSFMTQSASTLSTDSVIIAPLIDVFDWEEDDPNLVIVNISNPKHGVLELFRCCNTVKDSMYTSSYYKNKRVADYR